MKSIIKTNDNYENCLVEELKKDTTTEWLEWSDNYNGILMSVGRNI